MRLMTNSFAIFAMMLALTLTLLIPSSVVLGQEGTAQDGNRSYSGAPRTVSPDTIDDATVKQTAKAYVKVKQIVQSAQQALNKVNDDAQKQQIVVEAESKEMAAIKSEGLQPQQYNQVIQLARVDQSFAQKFLSYVHEVKNSSSGS
jgi:hypothetical protein